MLSSVIFVSSPAVWQMRVTAASVKCALPKLRTSVRIFFMVSRAFIKDSTPASVMLSHPRNSTVNWSTLPNFSRPAARVARPASVSSLEPLKSKETSDRLGCKAFTTNRSSWSQTFAGRLKKWFLVSAARASTTLFSRSLSASSSGLSSTGSARRASSPCNRLLCASIGALSSRGGERSRGSPLIQFKIRTRSSSKDAWPWPKLTSSPTVSSLTGNPTSRMAW
mmetsp:Transcript_116981/g.268492  ORF Transcript_116981/g.268492 Transcript_116981/m.268492 type:complete len:223 (-) Transcript_116981:518-1186(-)